MKHPPSLSYWELREYFQNVDLTIVGSGIVGLTTAFFYKQKFPQHKVLVLERGTLPCGASTKNAGFACFGSLSELLSDLNTMPEDELFELVRMRYQGLIQLKNLLGTDAIGYDPCGGFELFSQQDHEAFEKCMEAMPAINKRMYQELGLVDCYKDATENIQDFGFASTVRMILNQYEGSIDTGKMMGLLLQLAQKTGVIVLNGLEVNEWNDGISSVDVQCNNEINFSTNSLHFANNGFAKQLLPELDIQPARAQVLITEPIHNLRVKGTFHIEEGFYYFRNIDDRILLGGGRNLDTAGETTTELELTDRIQTKLNELLESVILPDTKVDVAHRWAGIMGVGNTKKTIVKRVSDKVTCSIRLGGMGVAIGTNVGTQAAKLIAT